MQELIHKNVEFEIKAVDGETGHFSGLANGTEMVDAYNDIIHEGAFKRTIKGTKGKVPVLKGHDSSQEIGMTLALSENGASGQGLNFDDAALYVDDANPRNEVPVARDELVRMRRRQELGVPMGISIGFTIPDGKSEYDDQGIRHIHEVKLWEISTTPFPANQASMVSDVKSIAQMPAVAKRVAADCKGPLCSQNRKAVEATILTLQSLLASPQETLPAGDPSEKAAEPEHVLSDSDFHSLMESLKIKV